MDAQEEIQYWKQMWQDESARHASFRAEIFGDPVIGEILRLRREVKSRETYEADLRRALAETEEEMAIQERTYETMLDEAEEKSNV